MKKQQNRKGRLSKSFGKLNISDAEIKNIKKELKTGWKKFEKRHK